MTSINSGVFIEGKSDSGQRVLHPAEILGSTGRGFTVKLQTTELVGELGQELMVYYARGATFLKQQALIESYTLEGFAEIRFALLGEPVSAEQRENYRVSAVHAELCVDIAEEMGCKLVDISATGCSVIANGQYRLGQPLRITLYHEDEPITGEAVVRSKKQLDAKRTRYGLDCVLHRDSDGTLKKGLRDITMTVQRSQLRRLSRA